MPDPFGVPRHEYEPKLFMQHLENYYATVVGAAGLEPATNGL